MRIGLRARFIIVISLVLLVLFATISYFLIRNERLTLERGLNSSSKAFAELATRPIGDAYDTYQTAGGLRVKQETQKFTDLDANITNIAVIGLDGKTLFAVKGQGTDLTANVVGSFDPVFVTNSAGVYTRIVEPYVDTYGQHKFAVVYDFSTSELEASASRDALTILIFAMIGLLVSAFVTYELINTLFLWPMEHVSRLAAIVGRGDYSQQIAVDRNDEIGDLARSVNQMADTLKGDIQKLQEVDRLKNEFIMIASHNLRTPLTIIKGYLDALRSSELTDEARQMVSAVETGALSLESFSEDMLTISTIEAGNTHPVTTTTSKLSDIINPLRENFTLVADQKKIKLRWDLPAADSSVRLSLWHARNALSNVIANAVKFTPEGGTATVKFELKDDKYTFTVSDTGVGIAAEEMDKLFTKFHRGTSTLEYNFEGTGIGLYATKLLVESQGGHVAAQSTPGMGSTFTITLPPLKPAAA